MSPARTKKPRVVKEPDPPVPAWLLTYEERAKAAGLEAKRCRQSDASPSRFWWLSVHPTNASTTATLSFFAATEVSLTASNYSNESPRDALARASVLLDLLFMVAPEALAHHDEKRTAVAS